jgi:hypothetical protein
MEMITRREALGCRAFFAAAAKAGQTAPHIPILGAGLSGLVAGYTRKIPGIP